MAFTLPPLPFAKDALAPHISEETLNFHYGKHHQAYVTKLNELVAGTAYAEQSLEDVIIQSAGKDQAIFNNAAQVWNHTFYWHCLTAGGGGKPSGSLADAIDRDFGSYDAFAAAFTQAALTQFGSGWAWLVVEGGKLKITKTANADTPLVGDATPILTCDVWEHAYYLDYQNKRPDYVATFLNKLVNWTFVAENFAKISAAKAA